MSTNPNDNDPQAETPELQDLPADTLADDDADNVKGGAISASEPPEPNKLRLSEPPDPNRVRMSEPPEPSRF